MENIYNCQLCNYSTINKYNLAKHFLTLNHKNKEEINKYCTLCNKTFDHLKTYKYHIYNVHNREKNKEKKKTKSTKSTKSIKLSKSNNISTSNKLDILVDKIDITNKKITESNQTMKNEISGGKMCIKVY